MSDKKQDGQIEPRDKYWANKKKTLGLDLGIASIGWCLFEEGDDNNLKRIIDIGSFVFNQIENPKSGQTENIARRIKRSMRRQRRRRTLRLEDARSLFKDKLGVDFFEVISSKKDNVTPFDIKVKGLHEKLTKEELCIALYHYLKYRGYKSNRKKDKGSDDSSKKILGKIKDVKAELADRATSGNGVYITELLVEKFKKAEDAKMRRYHNSSEEYYLTVSNEMYREEIIALLNKQISYGVIDGEFKRQYIELFDRRRDFSEGPGGESPYRVDFSETAGKCYFDGEKRACKDDYSAQMFILLSSLNNLRYKTDEEGEYHKLSGNQIREVATKLVLRKDVKYTQLFKELGIDKVIRVKGLDLTKKQYKAAIQKYAKKNKIEEGNPIPPENNDELSDFIKKETFDHVFFKGSEFIYSLTKSLKNSAYEKDKVGNENLYNSIAEILFKNKTDEKIKQACKDEGLSESLTSVVLEQDNASQTIDLSLPLCQKINPFMERGHRYDEAMKMAGYDHSSLKKSNVTGIMPPIDDAVKGVGEYLTNPVVKHTLVQMRRLINAITREYGAPTHYSIELARELKKNFQDRQEIKNQQQDNQAYNTSLKVEMLEKYPDVFNSFASISGKGGQGDNLIRYKLFKEQGGISPYTNKRIDERKLFDKNYYQIDHIAPYSQSFNDSYANKVLVETEENQNKKDRLPLKYLGENRKYLDEFLRTHRIDAKKRALLLSKEISSDFLNKDSSDNSYIAVLATKLIEFYMLPKGVHCRTTSGAITDKLRTLWGLAGKTHSYISNWENGYQAKFPSRYRYQSVDAIMDNNGKFKGISFVFTYDSIEKQYDVLLEEKGKGEKENKEDKKDKKRLFTKEQIDKNDAIEEFYNSLPFFQEKFLNSKDGTLADLQEMLAGNRVDANAQSSERYEYGLKVLAEVSNQIMDDINEKNRSNHLHHALDAAVIGAVTPGMKQKITIFYQEQERAYDPYTGEIKLPPLPLPYDDFRKEVLARVYERDTEKLLGILNDLSNYSEHPASEQNTHVLLPVRLPDKDVAGAISSETIYGVDKRTKKLTSKTDVSKLTLKNVENIIDKGWGNKAVYEACVKWLNNNKPTKYPVLDKKGTIVRSVKLVVADSGDGKVDLSNGRYADNSDNIRVNVYKKKGDDKTLYFVPVYYYQLERAKIRKKQIKKGIAPENAVSSPSARIMWGRGDNDSSSISFDELKNNYQQVACLPRYSLIEVENKDGYLGLAYSGGVTSGSFEVYSILGDNFDLISTKLFRSSLERMRFSVSTLSNVKVRSITILGKLN